MPGPVGLAAVEVFWARRLGCTTADLHRPGLSVIDGPGTGTFAVLRASTLIVAVPPGRRLGVVARLDDLTVAEAFAPSPLRAALGAGAANAEQAGAGRLVRARAQELAEQADVNSV